jgi:hypothetical protein
MPFVGRIYEYRVFRLPKEHRKMEIEVKKTNKTKNA